MASAMAENTRGNKEEDRRRNHGKNIMPPLLHRAARMLEAVK